MKVSLLGLCRGGGKIFIRARIEKTARENTLSIRSQSCSGTKLPCDYFPFIESNKSNVYIITLPILSITQKLIIDETDSQNTRISTFSKRLSPFWATWESRLNYKLKRKRTLEIKDYDKLFRYNRETIEFYDCIPDDTDIILRAAIIMQEKKNIDNISITCVDSSGVFVAINPLLLNVEVFSLVKYASNKMQKVCVSMRIPKEIKNYYFEFLQEESQNNNSFSVLEATQYIRLLEQCIDRVKNAQDNQNFDLLFKQLCAKEEILEIQRSATFPKSPLVSIVVPLYKTPIRYFCEMTDSVRNQSYQNWELILVQASPENNEVINKADFYLSADDRIRQIVLPFNKGISENTNAGIKIARGDFICFLDHDDLIEPDLLYEYILALNERENIDLLYCDEDKIDEKTIHFDPFFKPDFNLDLLRNNNYVCHLLCIRTSLLFDIGLFDPSLDGAQDHDLVLRACEKARVIHHVSKLLYHWRASGSSVASDTANKAYANEAGIKAVQNHLTRLGIEATVELSRRPFTYRINYAVPKDQPLVSIIIPNKDNSRLLKKCIDSIIEKSTYQNFEVIIIENNSITDEVFKYYRELSNFSNIRIIDFKGEFNFSKIVNFGIDNCSAEYLILLNNDTVIITENWIERMLGICSREDVGVVGAKLYYPDDTIQHAGVIIVPDVAEHSHVNLPRSNWGYLSLNDAEQNLSAVTAACLMTKRSIFNKLNGFNEELAVAYNDIDYCLEIRELNLLIVYTPEVELYHYESFSRGYETTKQKKLRFVQEAAYMRSKWAKYYVFGDPYLNKNLGAKGTAAQYFRPDWY